MDLKGTQDKYINLIKDNYKDYENSKYEVQTDFLDLDKYKQDFNIFVDFSDVKFINHLSDDCEQYGKLSEQIFLVVRNDTANNLKNKILNVSSTFYQLLKENDLVVDSLEFFNYATGTNYIVISCFNLKIDLET
jgi:hypothetical protein